MTAWTRCYNPKTAFGYASCVYYAARLKEKDGFNTAYCDVHTSKPPWSYVDYDACVPGAGTFQTTYRAYAAIRLEEKKALGGPVYSEGDCQFFYAGLSDGNYAQPGIHPDKNPWIVDFNLKRIHPLECDFAWQPQYVQRGQTADGLQSQSGGPSKTCDQPGARNLARHKLLG